MDDYTDWLDGSQVKAYREGEWHGWASVSISVFPDGRGTIRIGSSYPWAVASAAEASAVFVDIWTRTRRVAVQARKRNTL